MSKEIKPGQFFITSSILKDYPYSGAVKRCESTKGQRVYYRRQANPSDKYQVERQAEWDSGKPEYCLITSITIVSDTAEELHEIQKAGTACATRIRELRDQEEARLKDEVEAIRAKYRGQA